MKMLLLAGNDSAISKLPSATAGTFSFCSRFIIFLLAFLISLQINAQEDSAYIKTIRDRSAKIINTLEITDQKNYSTVLEKVMNQYFNLNKIHDQSKKQIADIKKQIVAKEDIDKAVKAEEEKKSSQLLQLHKEFIGQLKKNLTDAQVDKIKDGMTYNVLNVTYAAYQDKIPSLTTEQKEKIYTWLNEARELAMDEGSSEDKHKVFGKYKGRINNYLSDQGYDLRKEEKDWQERLRVKRSEEKTKS